MFNLHYLAKKITSTKVVGDQKVLTCARFAMSARSILPAGQFANVERQVEPFIANEHFQVTLVPKILFWDPNKYIIILLRL